MQNTLTGISHVFGTHKETDTESDPREKIQSVWWEWCQPSPKEDMSSKDPSESSSKQHKKIVKGITGWAMRDTMICDLPKHGKAQPNHPDPVGLPLDYMGKYQVFHSIRSDIYDLCQFYIPEMTGDPPEFPTPQEPATHGQIRDLLKLAHAIGWPYLILAHSADSVTAISMLREMHTTACLQRFQVNLQGKLVKLSFCPFCTYVGEMTCCTSNISS